MNVTMKIENQREIMKAFGLAPSLMAKNLSKAMKASLLDVQRSSMRITPVDTGFLRASHQLHMVSPVQGEVAVLADYAEFVHDGTNRMEGRPFLADAAEMQSGFIAAEFEQAVQRTLDEIGAIV